MRKQKLALILVMFFVSANLFAQSGWTKYQLNTNKNVVDINFINAQTGFATSSVYGYGTNIFKTTNSGVTWDSLFTTSSDIKSAYFNSSSAGWIVGRRWSIPYPANEILRTTNLGNSWTTGGTLYMFETYYKVTFLDTNYGWVGGSDGILLNTENGGNNWFMRQIGSFAISDIFFVSPALGWIVTTAGVFKTTDGGNVWDSLNVTGVSSIYFFNSSIGWAAGDGIKKTTNGGTVWQTQLNVPGLQKIKFINEFTGYSCGNHGTIYRTSDSGNNWTLQNYDSTYDLFTLDLINYNTIYSGGSLGTLLKSSNGGGTFILQTLHEVPDNFSLSQNYPNPFNPSTKINYEIKSSGFVSLKVFDLLGKEVAVLVNEKQNAGSYAVDFNSTEFNLPSGIYFYALNAGEFKETRKMVLVK